MLATLTQHPELEIDAEEAAKLAGGIGRVVRHYGIGKVNEVAADWVNLCMALSVVYGPRIILLRAQATKPAAPAAPDNITPFGAPGIFGTGHA